MAAEGRLISTSRRGFIAGLGALVCAAPAIVKADSLMKIRGERLYGDLTLEDFCERVMRPMVDQLAQQVADNVMNQNGNAFLGALRTSYEDEQLKLDFVNDYEFYKGPQWGSEFAVDNAKIGSTLRIRLPNDYVYDKERRTLVLPEMEQALVGGVVLGAVANKLAENPVVSRRFWK